MLNFAAETSHGDVQHHGIQAGNSSYLCEIQGSESVILTEVGCRKLAESKVVKLQMSHDFDGILATFDSANLCLDIMGLRVFGQHPQYRCTPR